MGNIELEWGFCLQWEEQIKAFVVPTSWQKKEKNSDDVWHEDCSMSDYIQSSDNTKHKKVMWNMNLQVVLKKFQENKTKSKEPQ